MPYEYTLLDNSENGSKMLFEQTSQRRRHSLFSWLKKGMISNDTDLHYFGFLQKLS